MTATVFRLVVLVALVSTLVSDALVSASWHPDFAISKKSNIHVEATRTSLHFTCSKLQRQNQQTRVFLPPGPVVGAAASFFVEAVKIVGTREVKLRIYTDVVLRWGNEGNVARWKAWEGQFIDLGPSKILPGTGKHSVTFVRGLEGFHIFEDGKLISYYRKPRDTAKPSFDVTVWTKGAEVDLWVTDIQIHYGLPAATSLATTLDFPKLTMPDHDQSASV